MLSIALAMNKKGYKTILLTTCKAGDLHKSFQEYNIETYNYSIPKNSLFIIKQFFFLIRFCRRHNIDYVYSHLQAANFIAVLAQYFISAKVLVCRHHTDYVRLGPSKNARLFDKVIGKLAKNIVAISDRVKREMQENEGVNPNKIIRINNAYDFSLFPPVDKKIKNKIIKNYDLKDKDIVLLNVGRMIPLKRQALVLELVYLLKKEGFNIRLLIVGSGQLETALVKTTEDCKITNEVVFTNQVNNIRDYMDCCDLQIHLSESEASNNVVKEFALLGKPSIVCKNVGDFEDYCTSENSYLIKKDFNIVDLKSIVIKAINNKQELKRKGEEIRKKIKSFFSIDTVIPKYLDVLK
jgi:glycosyltransferase involved in cell wall biosynthesis